MSLMSDPGKISIADFNYFLPEEKIAAYPLPERDSSKLLIYQNGNLGEDVFSNIAGYLSADSLLIFNDTKVINARVKFRKPTGTIIEIFCLEPYIEEEAQSSNTLKNGFAKWKCFVGGASKWKEKELIKEFGIHRSELKASLLEKTGDVYIIEFSWFPTNLAFEDVLTDAGDIPLPPYIKRNADNNDLHRYQTIYANNAGSVAAPTAGLHFTENIFERLAGKKIEKNYITLHVGAGTFRPIKTSSLQEHEMHAEWIEVNVETIKNIVKKTGNIIAIGTTSARTIETLYWIGVKIILNPELRKPELKQWEIYDEPLARTHIKPKDALNALITWIEKENQTGIFMHTQLLIVPGYEFNIIHGIVTNFHQPQSTLLLLVAAATKGNWRAIYEYALQNDFRFLSYGDGTLIFI